MNLVCHKLSEKVESITKSDLCKIYDLDPHVKVLFELFYEFKDILD